MKYGFKMVTHTPPNGGLFGGIATD